MLLLYIYVPGCHMSHIILFHAHLLMCLLLRFNSFWLCSSDYLQ